MLNEEKARLIFERVRKFSAADEVEVLLQSTDSSLTRFANNLIHQNVAEQNDIISIRTVIGGRTARATTNKTDDDALRRAVAEAEAITRVQEPDPDLLPMAEAALAKLPQEAPSRYFEETAALTPEERARAVAKIVAVADAGKLTTAGIYASSVFAEAVANSRGLFAFHRQTSAEVSVTMLAGDSSGWQKCNAPDARQLEPERLAETAARKALESAGPREVPPGKYTVILEPAAVLDLAGFMFWDWGGLALLEQRSFLNNRMGTRLFGDNITIWDDAYHPMQSGAPFDGEGVGRERVLLVENGVPKNLVYARASAEKMKKSGLARAVGEVRATGHGFPLPNEIGEIPMNIVIEGGRGAQKQTVDEMVASTERGILVTRLWYIREVDPYEKILTGMTRDGTFLIEGGKLAGGLRNFRFNESLIHMLSNVEALGEAVRASGEESFDMVAPAMKVRDFNFTEVTRF
jgi:PmbA protein